VYKAAEVGGLPVATPLENETSNIELQIALAKKYQVFSSSEIAGNLVSVRGAIVLEPRLVQT